MTAADVVLLRALAARPRLTGTDDLASARLHCASLLRGMGFAVRERPFTYSALPARCGMPAVGLASIALLGATLTVARARGPGWALAAAATGVLLLAGLARWLSSAWALRVPAARARGVNLEATRGDGAPDLWLVAHLDSKSQRYPLALRAAGASLTIAAWIVAISLSAVGVAGIGGWRLLWISWAVGAVGGALLLFVGTGNDSLGAVDNASGVVAVLSAARRLDPRMAVGVLLTDAEEMGLAGAHEWAASRAAGTAINCDTVDDRGAYAVLGSGRRSAALAAAVERAAHTLALPLAVRRLPAGILTDGVALARAGWRAVTVSRAGVATLLRIHTRRDVVGPLDGTGIETVAALLAATANEVHRWPS
ncbi:MAG: hypothetical protein B7Z72_04240 [Gemmatimonadetes bacterium 21-71-4]|nr:MAG: hypothetical protein B7Z72_04240 [Gemmatimonadetes bacterium 21-71-4]